MSKKALVITVLGAGLAVLLLLLRLLPFEQVLIGLYVLGVAMSGAFVFTWFPLAFRALGSHRKDISLLRIVDYAGLHLLIFLAFSLVARNLLVYSVPPPPDELAAFARVFLPIGLDVIIGLRLFTWLIQLWKFRHGGGDPELLEGMSKVSGSPDMPV